MFSCTKEDVSKETMPGFQAYLSERSDLPTHATMGKRDSKGPVKDIYALPK